MNNDADTNLPLRVRGERIFSFKTKDDFECNLIHVEGSKDSPKGPVILVHGAGVRANVFRAPVKTTLVDYLIDNGYDVWLENWRASIDFPPNSWTLDKAALYDHPEAVKIIVRETGIEEIKAVIHCQGSTSFMMSAIAGLVPQVNTIVSNAVSLHPVVPLISLFKSKIALGFISKLTKYLNPQWGLHAPTLFAKMISLFVKLTHHECDNPVCKQASFTYGVGFPTLWRHEQLNEETHEWIKQEFAHVPISFFQQMAHCLKKGHLVAVDALEELPADFVDITPKTNARIAFIAGMKNRCFLPESQVKSFNYFNALQKDYHSLHLFEGYSHLDVFMGKDAAKDIFPLILSELDKPH